MSRRIESPPERRAREWEYKNLVFGRGYYDKTRGYGKNLKANMASRGYDAMRVSPRTTTKHGHKYRVVYGASIEPLTTWRSGRGEDYRAPSGKTYPKVTWHKQGYVKATKKQRTGTVRLGAMNYDYDRASLRDRLMEPKRRTTRRRSPRRQKKTGLGSLVKTIFG